MPLENAPPLPSAPVFGDPEREEAAWLISRAVREDLPAGDITTAALFPARRAGAMEAPPVLQASFVARATGILCGTPVVEALFRKWGEGVLFSAMRADGDRLQPGDVFAEVLGPLDAILRLERIALNFLGKLSGIATLTRRWADELSGTRVQILDTRKTTPGWRRLEKYAVRTGGGVNHRMSLSDAILLKDNHAWALRGLGRGDVREWVPALRRACPGVFLEVEVDGPEEFLAALDAGVDAILLDNFSTEEVRWAVQTRDARAPGSPILEASGGLRIERLGDLARTGVDRISAGALTHSAPSLDVALDFLRVQAGVGRKEAGRAGGAGPGRLESP